MRIGELFAGYGGLGMGVQAALGGTVAWHSEIDKAATRILAHHWPDIPNLGDITTVDWAAVEPVDVLTGGWPCQDVSHAGKRLGLRPGTRSGLWSHMAYAISVLRPKLVIGENVRGLLSASAAGDVERCPWCVGDGETSPMRALGSVLGDLAGLGYDARWCGLRAADVGAPHGRFRVFLVAHPVGQRLEGAESQRERIDERQRAADGGRVAPDADRAGLLKHGRAITARPQLTAAEHGGHLAADAGGERHGGREDPRGVGRVDSEDADGARQRQRAREEPRDRGDAAARHPHGRDVPEIGRIPQRSRDEPSGTSDIAWGDYAPAIARWEHTLGRPAPAPTEPGRTGQPRLSPAFVEWLMGLPADHVTDPAIGISRNDQLKCLGNGVVPQQAEAAIRYLLAQAGCEAAA